MMTRAKRQQDAADIAEGVLLLTKRLHFAVTPTAKKDAEQLLVALVASLSQGELIATIAQLAHRIILSGEY